MASQEESVREFVAVTDVDEERARFFLESAGWNLQLALASFFEDGADDDIVTLPQPEGGSSVSRSAGPSSQPRVTSFRDLMHEAEEESDEEEGQRFFAGGSERSGQQIVGPPKKKSSNEVVEDLFKGAREHGAVPLDRSGRGPGETSKAKAFLGGGYRLGAAPEEESAYVSGERRGVGAGGGGGGNQQDVHVVLKLWKTGFSLDNGELRNYSDPGNSNFLEAIRRGEIPLELRQRSRGGQVNLDMEDHRDEDFSKPKLAFRAFGGEGQKLGSATPELVTAPASAQQDQAANEVQASTSVALDPSQPVTNIQIRLADGGRLVQKFNHTHRVSDLREFLVAARPTMAAREFVLMTTFPNKELTDESETLQQANLLNAVIVQLLK
ncbi:NSFL1 cofactor p47 [Hippoglossus hippoglossus]|uniref:NSFL1 cofactor p47 n=1 Tax=Hippoglossus hippoglossus TaxID=8267 RepID=UPI00148D71BC|nr:NSFL1 cofactor p47 [Hippoglossus hippoglossus]XP_035015336.1 NSFL1 cofactor p47 [Hippoglossus stenolepis]